ncbi:MAG: aspartyl protease family protein [Bacteroidota bacterium]|nr:aspartyl protease family protein [Bacteroidota bacterium]MDP4213636.1 aspartyl protease family protein [Bacteroidota bacterium]MDP4250630.1 aspartyl protease family protein [Bacteroidota bacterium]
MKFYFPFYFGCLTLLFFGCRNPERQKHNPDNEQLLQLLDQKEYFKLETRLSAAGEKISEEQRLYFQSFVDNAFNRNQEAIEDIDRFLKDYSSGSSDSLKASLYQLQSDSYFKLFEYGQAARSDSLLLARCSAALDNEKVRDVKNYLLIRNALKPVQPQETVIRDSGTIYWKKNKIGLIELPVKCNGSRYDGIFDTRANISSITQTYAARLGLKMLNVSYEEGAGITGIKFKVGLGIADSLYIGRILVRHAVFQVMPDSVLYIAPLKLSLDLIIGFPIIAQLKEIHLYRDGRMFIPSIPAKSGLHNFALDGLDPVISLPAGEDTLCFHLDLGADKTILYSGYFEKFKPQILREAIKKTAQYGGAGGVQKKEVYVLPALHLSLQDKKITMDSIDVLTQKIFPDERFYGNLGRDFADNFEELIFNFQYMYIEGR